MPIAIAILSFLSTPAGQAIVGEGVKDAAGLAELVGSIAGSILNHPAVKAASAVPTPKAS